MKSQHNFAFDVRDRVKIVGLEKGVGKVDQMVVAAEGKQYRVRYWDKGELQSVWLEDDEITPFEG